MLQDLREYLDENPENAVAPDWSENVRKSVRSQDTLLYSYYTGSQEIAACDVTVDSQSRVHHQCILFTGLSARDSLPPTAD